MLITKQQRFLLDHLEQLGGARLDQLTSLLRPAFCAKRPELAASITESALQQLHFCNVDVMREGELFYLPGQKPTPLFLEAMDVMLELSGGVPVSVYRGHSPILLHFCVPDRNTQEQKLRLFSIATPHGELNYVPLQPRERLMLLVDGQEPMEALPVDNKQFFAVRQEDGSHRFFAWNGHK